MSGHLTEGRRAMRAVAELERRSRAREAAPERAATQRALDDFHKAANEAPREYEDAKVRRLPQEEK